MKNAGVADNTFARVCCYQRNETLLPKEDKNTTLRIRNILFLFVSDIHSAQMTELRLHGVVLSSAIDSYKDVFDKITLIWKVENALFSK